MVKGCFNETIMETAYTGMVQALSTMIEQEGLENGGVFEDTREMMIKVCPMSSILISLGGLLECGSWLMIAYTTRYRISWFRDEYPLDHSKDGR